MPQRLVELRPGQTGLVRHLHGGHRLVSRLAALGFTPGAPVKIVRNAGHGPLLVSARGVQVALGREEAERVIVSLADDGAAESAPAVTGSVVIALAGQPNVGKSTIFNLLTGLDQHVGNWTGKTVELKMGRYTYQGTAYTLVDLPGTYSLTANSEEERIARDFILEEHPDVVVAVADAATLERNLYLLAELVLLPAPVILVLNMMDVAAQEGIQVEPKVLETALGLPVVAMSASRGQGIADLQETVARLKAGELPYQPKRPSILPAHQSVLEQVQRLTAAAIPENYPPEWTALKLLEGDEQILAEMRSRLPAETWEKLNRLLYQHEDAILDIAGARYEWIARMVRAAVVQPSVTRGSLTARLDRVLTHPLWGTLALVGVLGGVFWLTYAIGAPLQSLLKQGVDQLSAWLSAGLSAGPAWLASFLTSGLLGGLGMVLTFLPILAIFYLILGFMEDTGYMARAAYLTDRWMHWMGLHGKSFLPLLLSFGCNVPAVLGTRIIESRRARLLTILLIPLIPCTARMVVVTVLAPVFFGHNAFWVTWALVGGNLLILAGLGLVLHKFAFANEHLPFIMELPLYHLPNPRTIGLYVWQNVLGFLQKAGTTILAATLVVWVLSYIPNGDLMDSVLAWIGRGLAPIGAWMGLPWPVLIALLTSVVAKENTIATLGVIYGDLAKALPLVISPAAGLAALVFQMLFIPCVGTIAAIRQESGSLRFTALSVLLMLGLALGFAVLTFQVGRLL